MSSTDLTTLLDMGFDRARAERALQLTGNQGVEPAMEWLLAHAEEQIPSVDIRTDPVEPMEVDGFPQPAMPSQVSAEAAQRVVRQSETAKTAECDVGVNEAKGVAEDPEAKSLKCDQCQKLFKTQLEIEYHAAKSGHSSFSESNEEKKPLTEEEKREQLRKLEEKMRQKRLEREELEKRDALERERLRIKSGKEMTLAKKKLEELEMRKIVEQRKREKHEEKLARQRVKDQIEQDKIARKAKFATGSPGENGHSPNVEPEAGGQESKSSPPNKDYSHAKIQIRLTNGHALTHTFGAKEQLSAVRLYIEMNRTDGEGPFQMMTNFPKKVFADDDYEKPLDVLGLVPAAVVIVARALAKPNE